MLWRLSIFVLCIFAARPASAEVFGDRLTPHWFDDGKQFWFIDETGLDQRVFVAVDLNAGARRPAFDHARLAAALAKLLGQDVAADALPIHTIEFLPDASAIRLFGDGIAWELHINDYSLKALPPGGPDPSELTRHDALHPSPAGERQTYVTFINRTEAAVTISWCNAEGNLEPYFDLAPAERRRQHTFAGHVWAAADAAGRLLGVYEAAEQVGTASITTRPDPKPAATPASSRQRRRRDESTTQSPDGRWEAIVKQHDLWLRDLKTGEETALSRAANVEDTYTQRRYRDPAPPGLEEIGEPTVPEVYWSPDSKRLVAIRTHTAPRHTVYMVESSPPGGGQPRLQAIDYLKPGDEIPIRKPHLFDVENKKEIPVLDDSFANPFECSDYHWRADSSQFQFLYNQRGHQALRVLGIDASDGGEKTIIDEANTKFIDYSGKKCLEYLDDSAEIVWMSERDGWNHLYLYDANAGQVKNQITHGNWVVRGVDRIDSKSRQIWFRAGGIHPGQDPYYIHHCRVNFDGTGLTILTQGDGTHAIQLSPLGDFLIDTWSRVDQPPVHELRRVSDGSLVCELARARAEGASSEFPQTFVASGRDGETKIYGVIHRPRHFDARAKYPVVEKVYAGPQAAYAPKQFKDTYPEEEELTSRGFIVVQVDGMGTNFRSREFHEVCWQNLADAGFADRIAWIKAAAAKHPEMDISRVGIYGGSAGGQNAMGALLFHHDFYKAAVADCGCHDNRMDKIWWNEQWMGWPVGDTYAASSNVANAGKLKGELLLIVGELDHNVDPASTMQVVDALIKENKDFEMLVIPGAPHGAGSGKYGRRRTVDFFIRHLRPQTSTDQKE